LCPWGEALGRAVRELWAALAANQAIQVIGQRGAVVTVPPDPAAPATPLEAGADPTAAPGTATPVELPENVSGQSAAQQTCSNGNGYSG
jgi:hypothetical protein